jgi:DNA-directed RNA polymerase I, II, and III subunit RPABC2
MDEYDKLYSSSDEDEDEKSEQNHDEKNDSDEETDLDKLNVHDDNEAEVEVEEDDDEIDDNYESYDNEKYIPHIGGANGDNPLENDSDEEDDDAYQNAYLQKFNAEINKNYILDFHPECAIHNYDEISLLTKVIRDKENNIIDDLHKSIPFLTKYERTRVIGQRAKQINSGAKAFIKVPENVIDGYLVAELELMQKRIPFIVRRPTPGGGCEYWNLKDLEIISF